MTTANSVARRVVDPSLLPPRWARVLRAVVLVAIGAVITFSATLHSQLTFDVAMISSGLALIGTSHLIEWNQRRGKAGAPIALILGITSLVFAVLVFLLRDAFALAMLVAAWALVSALLEFVGMAVVPGSREDAPLIGGFGVLLSLFVLLSRDDVVAVIGFFGGYAVLAGVFLGIAAFDIRRGANVDAVQPVQGASDKVESE